jgi:hypothetical protein
MDALLARIVRVERRPGLALALVGAAVLVAVALVATLGGSHAVTPGCDPPVLDPAKVWDPSAHARVGTQTAATAVLDADIASWRTARAAACSAGLAERGPRLSCLDGVLARIDAVARAANTDRTGPPFDAGALLIDPKVCEQPHPPRLMAATSDEFREVVATWLTQTATSMPLTPSAVTLLVARSSADPCAAALAHLLAYQIQTGNPERNRHLDEALQSAERCGDDRVAAQTAIASAQNALSNEFLSATVTSKLASAETAVRRVPQRDLTAEIDLMRGQIARRAENADEAVSRGLAAMEGFAARGRLHAQIRAGQRVLELRAIRATPADLADIPGALAAWRARAVAELGKTSETVRSLDIDKALWDYVHGDLSAHQRLEQLSRPVPNERSERVAGIVVDARGKPVEGATVTTDAWL